MKRRSGVNPLNYDRFAVVLSRYAKPEVVWQREVYDTRPRAEERAREVNAVMAHPAVTVVRVPKMSN
jgi:hypothetical protein